MLQLDRSQFRGALILEIAGEGSLDKILDEAQKRRVFLHTLDG